MRNTNQTGELGIIDSRTSPGNGGDGAPSPVATFTPNDAILPAAASAGIGSRNGRPLVAYDMDDDESADFEDIMPVAYDPALPLIVRLVWCSTVAVGAVKWNAAFEAIQPFSQNVDADHFAAPQSTTTTTANNGEVAVTSISFTQAQAANIAATNMYRLRVTRDADDPADTMNGDAQLLRISIEQS